MKKIIVLCIIITTFSFSSFAEEIEEKFPMPIDYTSEEKQWLDDHEGGVLTLGLDPYSGMDYFDFKDKKYGYIIDVVKFLEVELDMQIDIIGDSNWGEVYEGFINDEIDILFGANVTQERLLLMDFTEPIHRYPYAVFSAKNSSIKTMGDLDGKSVGFIEGDVAIELLKKFFPQLQFNIVEYDDQIAGLEALQANALDGFVTSGGGIIHDFIYNYQDISFLTNLETITSDMTLATLKQDQVLNSILTKVIEAKMTQIKESVLASNIIFNRKILNLSDKELAWLENDGRVVVAVVNDYLPFDYFTEGRYEGVAGTLIHEISNLLGIKFDYAYGEFDDLYAQALTGKIDIINIAKTNDRLEHFLFPRAFGEERDVIYGEKGSAYISDIYGLEDKKVAVIRGFWHENLLNKNLSNVDIIITENIKESLKLVNSGKVDYFIENPTVADYYISGLGYWNIIKKGETSQDSFLYFGIAKENTELASIIDKTLLLIDYDRVKQEGLDTVPGLVSRSVVYLVWTVIVLLIILGIIILILMRFINLMIKEREEKAILKEREHMMYIDPLTNLKNRLYYNYLEKELDDLPYPQAIIISDLNKLKSINDTLGHHMGDAYIKAFGDLLYEVCQGAIVCRMGGDEFTIIATDCDEEGAEYLVTAIRKESLKKSVIHDDQEITHISAAIGYAIRKNKDESLETVSIRADNRMYENKKMMKKNS